MIRAVLTWIAQKFFCVPFGVGHLAAVLAALDNEVTQPDLVEIAVMPFVVMFVALDPVENTLHDLLR